MQNLFVETDHGTISYADSGGRGASLVFVHGNSACKEYFARQFDSPLRERYRLIALDLPGHGASANASDPMRSYSIHGFADATMAFLDAIGVERAVLVGWSLGGHIVLEMMARWPGAIAGWITGTPPAGGADMAEAFLPSDTMGLTFKEVFSEQDARLQTQSGLGAGQKVEAFMVASALRADGRFRPLMLQSAMEGHDMDGGKIARECPLPLAVVTGSAEPYVNNAFLMKVAYANLWEGRVHVLEDMGHMPFWQAPDIINPMLSRFLEAVLVQDGQSEWRT